MPVEQRVINYLTLLKETDSLDLPEEKQCTGRDKYLIYLIDNFDQQLKIVPELMVSHGELLHKVVISGRDDIDVRTLNTSLGRGLALVIEELINGGCADAVISSIPGSNYTYRQINSIVHTPSRITSDNIHLFKEQLLRKLETIGQHGFPSLEYLTQLDLNSVKLREDARKTLFIETLGKMKIPVLLPYGNTDRTHNGEIKAVNLLSLSTTAKVYSGIDPKGKRLAGYPYSVLSSGDEKAVYQMVECPDADDPTRAKLDVNGDSISDFSYSRKDLIPYYDPEANLAFAPPLLNKDEFAALLNKKGTASAENQPRQIVLTTGQYSVLVGNAEKNHVTGVSDQTKSFVWLHSRRYIDPFFFNPQCQTKGELIGTSLIPPMKVKELLPQKSNLKNPAGQGAKRDFYKGEKSTLKTPSSPDEYAAL